MLQNGCQRREQGRIIVDKQDFSHSQPGKRALNATKSPFRACATTLIARGRSGYLVTPSLLPNSKQVLRLDTRQRKDAVPRASHLHLITAHMGAEPATGEHLGALRRNARGSEDLSTCLQRSERCDGRSRDVRRIQSFPETLNGMNIKSAEPGVCDPGIYCSPCDCAGGWRGKRTVNTVSPSDECASMLPPCAMAIAREMNSPSPSPPCRRSAASGPRSSG